MTHGLVRGGISVTLGVDIDRRCRYPIERNNPTKFVAHDVSNIDPCVIRGAFSRPTVSLLVGCPPCQPFSTYSQGSRAGERARDWTLVETFAQLVRDTMPDLVSLENVPALRRQLVYRNLRNALRGYYVRDDVVDCSILGVPQTRRRLVLMASRFGPIEPLSNTGRIVTVREAIGHLPEIRAGETHSGDSMHVASRLSAINLSRIRASRPGGTWRDWPASLRARCHERDGGKTYPAVYGRMGWDAPAPTITTQFFGYGNGRFGHPEQDRAISLREAAILQTFPNNYEFVTKGERASFSWLGRVIGNAVPVTIGEAVARALVKNVLRWRPATEEERNSVGRARGCENAAMVRAAGAAVDGSA